MVIRAGLEPAISCVRGKRVSNSTNGPRLVSPRCQGVRTLDAAFFSA